MVIYLDILFSFDSIWTYNCYMDKLRGRNRRPGGRDGKGIVCLMELYSINWQVAEFLAVCQLFYGYCSLRAQ